MCTRIWFSVRDILSHIRLRMSTRRRCGRTGFYTSRPCFDCYKKTAASSMRSTSHRMRRETSHHNGTRHAISCRRVVGVKNMSFNGQYGTCCNCRLKCYQISTEAYHGLPAPTRGLPRPTKAYQPLPAAYQRPTGAYRRPTTAYRNRAQHGLRRLAIVVLHCLTDAGNQGSGSCSLICWHALAGHTQNEGYDSEQNLHRLLLDGKRLNCL